MSRRVTLKEDLELDELIQREQELVRLQNEYAKLPQKLAQEERDRQNTMPPLEEIEERKRRKNHENTISRGEATNIMRDQSRSVLLLIALLAAIGSLVWWGVKLMQQGISMISFKPQGQPRSFEVGPGKKVDLVDGEEVESLIFTKWMVMIPTVTKFRIIRQSDPKPTIIESVGFQIAISDKGKNDWTFIDGSGLTVNDLRMLFPTLPQDIEFPPLVKRESR